MPRLLALTVAAAALAQAASAAQRKETVLRGEFDLDPGEERRFEAPCKGAECLLRVYFEVLSPQRSGAVRASIWPARGSERPIQATSYRREAALRARLAEPGAYVVVIDNSREARRRCRAYIEVTLITGPDPATLPVSYASPGKRLLVVAVSLGLFLLIAAWAGWKLWRAARRRPRYFAPPSPSIWV